MFRELTIMTTKKEEAIDITGLVENVVEESQAREAGVFVYVPHSDAAVNIQGVTSQDPPLNRLLKKVLQEENGFEEPQTGAAFVAPTEILIAVEGKLLLGEGQRIYFYEFNGPKKRSVYVLVIAAS
ncbi:MAG: YjbQ family protein [Atribacterota bacterium]|nr:YjbQ family protein [Atribacterota bacterium]